MTDVPNLTIWGLEQLMRAWSEWDDELNEEVGPFRGVAAPILPNEDDWHPWVEDDADYDMFTDHETPALIVAEKLGLNVHRRYDAPGSPHFRVFLARPGSPDDHDFIAIGADEFGCNPHAEVFA